MSDGLRALLNRNVRVVLQDGSVMLGSLALVDERFNVGLRGARDTALAGTPLERASADTIRIVRGVEITGVFAVE